MSGWTTLGLPSSSSFCLALGLQAPVGMATTALNSPHPTRADRKEKAKVTSIVTAVILVSIALLIAVVYMVYRDVPPTGSPGEIDNAQGVTPAYPPVTPAEVPASPPQP